MLDKSKTEQVRSVLFFAEKRRENCNGVRRFFLKIVPIY